MNLKQVEKQCRRMKAGDVLRFEAVTDLTEPGLEALVARLNIARRMERVTLRALADVGNRNVSITCGPRQ